MSVKPRLKFLEGLRGISALYVVLYHATLFTGHGLIKEKLPFLLKVLTAIFSFGHFAVAIFIVLSGYCLTIPVALSKNKKLRGGFKSYIIRRAKRILPPYYASLFLFVILISVIPLLHTQSNTAWDTKIPVDLSSIVAHLFMIHNFNQNWIFKIDGPMWSVAPEWQIYFIFPLLLFIWRRLGVVYSIIFSFSVSLIILYFIPITKVFHIWYLGLFSLGMVAAIITFCEDSVFVKIRQIANWQVAFCISLALLLSILGFGSIHELPAILTETAIGVSASLFIIYLAINEITNSELSIVTRLLNSLCFEKLGRISYSVYLIHSPILAFLNLVVIDILMTDTLRLMYMIFVSIPVSLFISYIFYLLVEKRVVRSATINPVTLATT